MTTNKTILNKLMKEFLPDFINARNSYDRIDLLFEYYTERMGFGKDNEYREKLSYELKNLYEKSNYEVVNEVYQMERLYMEMIDCALPEIDINGNFIKTIQPNEYLKENIEKIILELYRLNWNDKDGYCFEKDKLDNEVSFKKLKLFIAQITYEIIEAFGLSQKPRCGDFISRCKNCNKLIGKTRSDKDYCNEECRQLAKSKRQYMEKKKKQEETKK